MNNLQFAICNLPYWPIRRDPRPVIDMTLGVLLSEPADFNILGVIALPEFRLGLQTDPVHRLVFQSNIERQVGQLDRVLRCATDRQYMDFGCLDAEDGLIASPLSGAYEHLVKWIGKQSILRCVTKSLRIQHKHLQLQLNRVNPFNRLSDRMIVCPPICVSRKILFGGRSDDHSKRRCRLCSDRRMSFIASLSGCPCPDSICEIPCRIASRSSSREYSSNLISM